MKKNDEMIKLIATIAIAVILGLALSAVKLFDGKREREEKAPPIEATEVVDRHVATSAPAEETSAPVATPSAVPVAAATTAPTDAPAVTATAAPTATATPTPTPTAAATSMSTPTPTAAPTATPTATPIATAVPTPAITPVPEQSELWIAHAKAFASHDAMSNGISFEADHLLDKDDLTSWQYDITETGGQPAYVVFELGSPAAVTQLAIKNGYWKISSGYDQYTRNGRVREFEVSFMYLGREHEGYQDAQYYWLEDEKREQFFDLGCVQNVISVRLRIQSIYQGTKFVNDVAMNDVKLFGYPSE